MLALEVGYLVLAPVQPDEVAYAVGRSHRVARLDNGRLVSADGNIGSLALLLRQVKVHGQFGAVLVAQRHGLVRAQGVQRGIELFRQNCDVIPASGAVCLLPERVGGSFGIGTVGVERAALLGEDDVTIVVGFGAAVPRVSCGVSIILGELGGGHEAVCLN